MRCGVAKLDAELSVIKYHRNGPEWADLESYVKSDEFKRRAAEVKKDALDTLSRCEPINISDAARALGLPLDAAAIWLTQEIAIPFGDGTMRIKVNDTRGPPQ